MAPSRLPTARFWHLSVQDQFAKNSQHAVVLPKRYVLRTQSPLVSSLSVGRSIRQWETPLEFIHVAGGKLQAKLRLLQTATPKILKLLAFHTFPFVQQIQARKRCDLDCTRTQSAAGAGSRQSNVCSSGCNVTHSRPLPSASVHT